MAYAAFAVAIAGAPTPTAANPDNFRRPGETGPLTPAEDLWGRVATLLEDPATPLTRKTVERALGVRLKLDTTVGDGSNVFRLPTPAKWPVQLSLALNITEVDAGKLVPGMTSFGVGWYGNYKPYKVGQPYCVHKSDFEVWLNKHGWKTNTSLAARLSSIAMDAPIIGSVWKRGEAKVGLSSPVSPDYLGDFTLDKPTIGDQK